MDVLPVHLPAADSGEPDNGELPAVPRARRQWSLTQLLDKTPSKRPEGRQGRDVAAPDRSSCRTCLRYPSGTTGCGRCSTRRLDGLAVGIRPESTRLGLGNYWHMTSIDMLTPLKPAQVASRTDGTPRHPSRRPAGRVSLSQLTSSRGRSGGAIPCTEDPDLRPSRSLVAVTIDWAIPASCPGTRSRGCSHACRLSRAHPQELTGYYTEAFGFDVPLWEAVPELLGRAPPRRSRPQHRELPDTRLRAHPRRAPVHARTARSGGPAQLLGREQGWRPRRTPEGARQHRPPRRLRPDRDAPDVARTHPRVAVRFNPAPLPGLGGVRAPRYSRSGHSSSRGVSYTTGYSRSPHFSSLPSAVGRSG